MAASKKTPAALQMVCCKCGQTTKIKNPKATPGAVQCSTCAHWECNDCDFKCSDKK